MASYEICVEDGCSGAKVAHDLCLVHQGGSHNHGKRRLAAIHQAVRELCENGRPIDLRGAHLADPTVSTMILSDSQIVGAIRQGFPSEGGVPYCCGLLLDDAIVTMIDVVPQGEDLDRTQLKIKGPLTATGAKLERLSFSKIDVRGPTDFSGGLIESCDFIGAAFRESVKFESTRFSEFVSFRNARFEKDASFRQADFDVDGEIHFSRTTFSARMDFTAARFKSRLNLCDSVHEPDVEGQKFVLDEATLSRGLTARKSRFAGDFSATFVSSQEMFDLSRARFTGSMNLDESIFSNGFNLTNSSVTELSMNACLFAGNSLFTNCVFKREVSLERSRFRGLAQFDVAGFQRSASFQNTIFEGPCTFFRADFVGEQLDLDKAVFEQPLTLEVASRRMSCRSSSFQRGLILAFGGENVDLENSEFGAQSLIEGSSDRFPEMTSLSRANVENLTIDQFDLEACLMRGCRNLDRLRLGPEIILGRMGRNGGRRVIADEVAWRAAKRSGQSSSTIAPLYRALRIGRETQGDSPGAADFYYGEMEMRRHSDDSGFVEKSIVWLYCVFSGYGLRASRSFAALIALWAISFAVLWKFCFTEQPVVHELAYFVVRTSVSFVNMPDLPPHARAGAAWVELGLRMLGPLLIALGLLAIRGRIKR
ncbi:MAG TPA: pentapeptide repeat-containing protein [Solirubrobacterales bacterium]|nr:pentapeptide repeat-containing protein [Solirubrobacterales bacterium]